MSITAGLAEPRLVAQSAARPAVSITRLDALYGSVWPGDFNGDGKTDLAASSAAGRVIVVLGNGNGTFGAPIQTSYAGHVLAVADFNRDGRLDLVAGDDGRTRVSILPGAGGGSFGAPVTVESGDALTFASAADLDGDGRRDLIVGSEADSVRVYRGRGDFTFDPPVQLTSGSFPNDAIVVDLNGDSRKDVVVANHYSNFVTVFLNRGGLLFGAGEFTVGGTANDVTAADLNGDGAIDLIVATSLGPDWDLREGHAEILLGRGDGTFAPPMAYAVARGAWQVVVGDFNGDGVLDIATANRSSIYVDDCSGGLGGKTWDTVSILTGNRSGAFAPARTFSLGDQANATDTRFKNRVQSLNTNDINRDGRTDLIASFGALLFTVPAVTNRAPTVDAGPDQSVDVGGEFILQAFGVDPDQDALSWSWRDSAGRAFAGWPNVCTTGIGVGPNVFTLVVDDGQGGQASDTVTIYGIDRDAPADQRLVVTSPAAGEVVPVGIPYTIRWAIGQFGPIVDVSYSLDGGETFRAIDGCTGVATTAGQCAWTSPGPAAESARVRVSTNVGGVTYSGRSGTFHIRSAASDLPWPWQHIDIGAVGAAGDAKYAGGAFTVDGSGADIWNAADEFHFVYQTGEIHEVTARVDSVENVDVWTKAGVMARVGFGPDAPHVSIFVTPGKGIAFQRRLVENGTSFTTPGPITTAPVWLRLIVRGNTVSGWYKKNDGDLWAFVGEATLQASGSPDVGGLAVTSHADGRIAAAAFSHAEVNPARLPEIGFALIGAAAGSAVLSPLSATSRGVDIWNTADQFGILDVAYGPVDSILVHVRSLTNTHPWAKAGIMIRASHAPDSAHVMIVATPERGISLQSRASTGDISVINGSRPGAAPAWLRMERRGTNWTASVSADATTWAVLGTVALNTTAPPVVGLASTSHSAAAFATAVFDYFAVSRSNP